MKLYKYKLLTLLILAFVLHGCGDSPVDKPGKSSVTQSPVTGSVIHSGEPLLKK
ncbi:MAG: hypothetical protein IPJ75_08260 [Ignavibacteriales bacterium]|nr:hypothetical protein [Ignavibacteriales bacterium]